MRKIYFKKLNYIQQMKLFLLLMMIATGFAHAKMEFQSMDKSIFAKLGKSVITMKDYNNALHTAAREKTYHGKIPEQRVKEVRSDVGRSLIARELLLDESKRRNFKADSEWVNGILSDYQKRNVKNSSWQEQRKIILPKLKKHFDAESLIRNLHLTVTDINKPNAGEIKKYYQEHPDKFTQPARYHVSVILLKVDPSLPKSVWDAANEEGGRLLARLKKGADFTELAKLHSSDVSANQGGDMGYLHKGMLAPAVQKIIDKMKKGEVSIPVTTLQGVGIFRLEDKEDEKLNPLEVVHKRVAELYLRDKRKQVWSELIIKLWKAASITVNKKHSSDLVLHYR